MLSTASTVQKPYKIREKCGATRDVKIKDVCSMVSLKLAKLIP